MIFKKTPQTCINCAFCMRCKDTVVYIGTQFVNNNINNSLTDEERKNALANQFYFIGKEIREREIWKQEYEHKLKNLKRGKYNNYLGNENVLTLLEKAQEYDEDLFGRHYQHFKELGMGEMPEAPNEDYLACWHDFWNFKDNEKDLPTLNNENECLFFYPYTKKGNKSFEACEKERQESSAKERFKITNILVIAGLFATIISIAVSLFIYNASKKTTMPVWKC